MRVERKDVCKLFHIWLGTEEALNKNAGSLPFLYLREVFFRDELLPIMASRIKLYFLKVSTALA